MVRAQQKGRVVGHTRCLKALHYSLSRVCGARVRGISLVLAPDPQGPAPLLLLAPVPGPPWPCHPPGAARARSGSAHTARHTHWHHTLQRAVQDRDSAQGHPPTLALRMPQQPCLALGQLPSHVQPWSSALQHERLSPAQRHKDPKLTAGGDERCEHFPPQPHTGLRSLLRVLHAGLSPCRTRASGRAESGSARPAPSRPVLSRVGGLAPETLPLLPPL